MNRTTAIIATVATALFCGCPGLGACGWGALFAAGGASGSATTTVGGQTTAMDPTTAILMGVGVVCLGVILVLIPVAVGFFTLRQKPPAAV
jgi:hypothetical protein